ncbi:MAG: folylpolyglutamate synthase/dihydrofolate synthase family protein [Bryobacteraceae bacterium]
MTYPDSVRFLYSLGNETKVIKLGLERIRLLLGGLGDPQAKFDSIHVAGTNGKGSTAAMIEAGLRAAGRRTGLYTSPHLNEPTERVQIAGSPVSEDLFAQAFHAVHEEALRMIDEGIIDGHPTYFESVTAMAFLLFRDQNVETAVVEVGLGGRLDATNVIVPKLCVITPVDYDHEQYLGSSLTAIASEKAGILKPGVPVLAARQHPEAMDAIAARAAVVGAPVLSTIDWRVDDVRMDARGSSYTAWRGDDSMNVVCQLAGEHQIENSLAAALALRELGLGPGSWGPEGIGRAKWPGRLERVSERPEIILDGAHNPAGIRALAAYVERFYAGRRVWLIYGAVRDKSLAEIAEVLSGVVTDVVLVPIDSPRAVRPEALRPLFTHARVSESNRLEDTLSMVRRAAAGDDVVFVTGSLYLVGEARRILVGS